MPLIPDDPLEQRKFLVVLLAVAAGAAYYMYLYQPGQQELQELEGRVMTLQTQNQRTRARAGNVEEIRTELEETEQLFRVLQRLVPSKAEVPQLYESIATETQAVGLQLQHVVPSRPQSQEGRYYLRQVWDMRVTGGFHDIGEFLARVASLPRIVRPAVSSINPGQTTQEGQRLAEAAFELETYVLPPDTAGSANQSSGASD